MKLHQTEGFSWFVASPEQDLAKYIYLQESARLCVHESDCIIHSLIVWEFCGWEFCATA